MVSSAASTVEQYLAQLPPERREVVARVRDVVRGGMPAGYVESIGWGMICWHIPLARYPDTYNGQPLGYVCLGAQKNYFVLHMMALYMNPTETARFAEAFAARGKKLDMGKGCVRFRTLDHLPLDVIGETVARVTPERYIELYELGRASRPGAGARKATAKKVAAKKAPTKKSATKKSATRNSAAKKKSATRSSAKSATKASRSGRA